MGTRAVILVTGSHYQGENIPQTICLYRHHDGDPDWTLKDIAAGIRTAKNLRAAQFQQWADPPVQLHARQDAGRLHNRR